MTDVRTSLALIADCLRPDAGGHAAAARRRRCKDWSGPIAVANMQYVSATVYAVLRQAGALGDLPDDARNYLALVHDRNGVRNDALRHQAVELVEALYDAGVRPLLLKGTLGLFHDLHDDPAARMTRDLDVLVPRSASRIAVAALRRLGYAEATRFPDGHHAYGDFTRPGDPGAVDLHFELIDANYLLAADDVIRRARIVRIGAAETLVPSPTDQLLHTFLHAQIHHLAQFYRGVFELRQLDDFARQTRFHLARIDWQFIERRMARHRLEAPLHAFAHAANRHLGLPWPLRAPPRVGAPLQAWQWGLQLRWPGITRITVPLGSIRSALVWHRMQALYGCRFGRVEPVVRHLTQYARKADRQTVVERLFRTR